MKFKENFKRFFTLDRHSNAGFTLVELIVVIAILAILAGVAIPVYSGYIAKANEAADYQLLGAINQAYVAACVEKSVVPADGTTLPVSGSKLAVPTGDVWDAFKVYFGDNINTSFKTVENGTLTYVTAKGGFQLPDDGAAGVDFKGIFGAFKDNETFNANLTAINTSKFGDIGAQGLMNQVDNVVGMATALALNPNSNAGKEFMGILYANMDDMANALGIEGGAYDENGDFKQEFLTKWQSMSNTLAASTGMDPDTAMNQVLTNYAVLQAAQSTVSGNKTAAEQLASMNEKFATEGGYIDAVMMMVSGDSATVADKQQGLADAAAVYAMYTAYANRLDDNDPNKAAAMAATGSLTSFAGILDNKNSALYQGFTNYLTNDPQATVDMSGYLGAMNVINDSMTGENSTVAVEQLLSGGYTGGNLVGSLQDILDTNKNSNK